MHCVLVLGGYGFFGKRIAAELARQPGMRVLIAGRNLEKARSAARILDLADDHAVVLDAHGADLSRRLGELGVDTVVHTAGPFQGQGYRVAEAAIAAGVNYIDLADGRDFVVNIGQLDEAARRARVTIVSGASSVPGLSSAVVDQYRGDFSSLETIRMGIGTGARTPGLATVQGIFGYCGKPISRLENGSWTASYGWLDLKRHTFPAPVGRRWLGSCDIPDLDLFPKRYSTARTVTFHAGFASDLGHLVVWCLAKLVRLGVLNSMRMFAPLLTRLSTWIEPLVSDKGAMFVEMHGRDASGSPVTKIWNLVVSNNHGPYVPCGASIALVKKLSTGGLPAGAFPCMGLLTVDEYLAPLSALNIRVIPSP